MGEWWLHELSSDPTYREVVEPLVVDLSAPRPGERVLDVGCGEGRIMAALQAVGARPIGCDLEPSLLRRAAEVASAVRCVLPNLGWADAAAFDAAVVCLVLEHLADVHGVFDELARVVAVGGSLVVVMNHPVFTAPGSGPVIDVDGEVLWRTGTYLEVGWTDEPAGAGTIRFHHRPLGQILTAAAQAGWMLEVMEERGVEAGQVERVPSLAGQEHIPRLVGFRWRRIDRESPARVAAETRSDAPLRRLPRP